jgi:integrase
MEDQMHLSDKKIRELTLPEGVTSKTFFDDELPGFGVRVRRTGHCGFVIQYRAGGKQRRLPLGSVGSTTLAKARAAAREQLAIVRLGSDPFTAKARARAAAAESFGALLPAFLEAKRIGIGAKKVVPRWHAQITEMMQVAAKPLHKDVPRLIDRARISDLLDAVTKERGAGAANHFRSVLASYWTWLIWKGRADFNPVSGTRKPADEVSRERVLADVELREIWHAVDGEFGDIVRLLILTGCRRNEVGDLRWSEIDFDEALITVEASRMKNAKAFEVPMTPAVIALLKAIPKREGRDLVFGNGANGFSSWSRAKAELDERLSLPHWVLHDIRRSFSTTLNERLEIAPHIVEAALSHVTGGKVARAYNKSTHRDAKRAALQKWSDHIAKHVSGGGNVVKLRKRG